MAVHILQYSDVETALDEPERCGALAGTIHALAGEETIVAGSGDNTAPGALSLATDGHAALTFFDAVDPAVDTFGNHDFDFGPENARELAGSSPQTWLCANATTSSGRFAPEVSQPSTLVETDEATIGFIGVSHPKTSVINPAAAGVEFSDPVEAVTEEVRTFEAQAVDHVVVVSHCGRDDKRIARETDVDAILGGHVHDVYQETVAGTTIVRPGRAGRYVSEVILDGGIPSASIHEVDDGYVDDSLVEALRQKRAENGLDEVVTHVEVPISRTEEAATSAGSRIGHLLTDALRWRTEADVAISPPGTIRSGDPLAGDVTVADLLGMAPYRDELTTVDIRGDRLRDAFVAVPTGYHDDAYPNRYCSHVSGAHLVWDDEAGELLDASVGGESLDPSRWYTVAVADYLVETDHVNDAFGPEDVVDTFGIACDAVVDFAREIGLDGGFDRRVDRPSL